MKILAVDAGRGTQDILVYDPSDEPENSLQMVLPSRTVLLARRIEAATAARERVLLHGFTMGGGPLTRAARRHREAGLEILATPAAAASFSDDPGEVAALGVVLVGGEEIPAHANRSGTAVLETADVHLPSLCASLQAWGIAADFDGAAVAVQDHGAAPPGTSDRRYRFAWFRETLSVRPDLRAQCFSREDIPDRFTRMRGVADSLPEARRLVLMDTGFAALLGACFDPVVAAAPSRLLVNAGNGHTLAALTAGDRVAALFEHHTRKLDPAAFNAFLDGLVRGTLEDERVFADGGHGAWRGPLFSPDFPPADIASLTGPRRRQLAAGSRRWHPAAPFGSMMQTGCYGLLAAFYGRHPELEGSAGWLAS